MTVMTDPPSPDQFGIDVVDGRDSIAIIVFRDGGDHITTELRGVTITKLELAQLCMNLGRTLKAQHDAETEPG